MSAEENKEIVRRFYEQMDKGNRAIIGQLFATNFVFHVPGSPDIHGPEGFKEFATPFLTAFPDLKHVIEDMIAEGDKVAVRFTFPGTHKGEFMGIAPTGKKVVYTAIGISRIANGKYVESWAEHDALGLLQQLGVVPAEERKNFTWGEPSEVTGEPGDPEENKALVRRAFEEVWNQGKLDVIDEIFAADFVYHIAGSPDIHGPDGEKQFVTMHRTAFPDIKFTVEDWIAEGDKVVTRWTFTGTHKGELMGISPTGVQVTMTGISIGRIAGGKIVEVWGNADSLGMLQQLGAVPPLGQGE